MTSCVDGISLYDEGNGDYCMELGSVMASSNLHPVPHEPIAVVIVVPKVARSEPPISTIDFVSQIWAVQIALCHIRASNPELSGFTSVKLVKTIRGHDLRFAIWQKLTHRIQWPMLVRIGTDDNRCDPGALLAVSRSKGTILEPVLCHPPTLFDI